MYRPPDPSCLQNLAEHWPAYLIDLSGEPYSHMQWRFGNTCWSAETSGFTAIKALDAAQYDGTSMAYTFNPPLPIPWMMSRRVVRSIVPSTDIARKPASRNWAATCSACATVTQNAMAGRPSRYVL